MAITKQDLQDFAHFADQRLSGGGANSLSELVDEWEARRRDEQSVADLLESHADAESGRVHPADDVFNEIRRDLGLSELLLTLS